LAFGVRSPTCDNRYCTLAAHEGSLPSRFFSWSNIVVNPGGIGYNGPMKIYIAAYIVLALVLVGEILGIKAGYFVVYPFYDMPMHILGGLGIGLFVGAFVAVRSAGFKSPVKVVLVGVLVAGLLWELFEIYYNIAGYPLWTKAYYLDTAKDLIDDMIGGSVAALILKAFKHF